MPRLTIRCKAKNLCTYVTLTFPSLFSCAGSPYCSDCVNESETGSESSSDSEISEASDSDSTDDGGESTEGQPCP